MTLKPVFFSLVLFFIFFSCNTTSKYLLYQKTEGTPKHPRALAVNDDGLMVIAGHDGGFEVFQDLKPIKKGTIPEMEDLRDAEILEDGSIVFMNSGNKGEIWRYFLQNDSLVNCFKRDSIFLDGISFWNNSSGIGFGDPVNNKLTIIRTTDSSRTWTSIDFSQIPMALENEAGFAASGTGIATLGSNTVYIGTGSADTARLYCSYDQGVNWEIKNTPMNSGGAFGIYAMTFWSEQEGVIIGGSYSEPSFNDSICFFTTDSGDTWLNISEGLGGYCSGIDSNADGSLIVATGRMGTYFTTNKGENWIKFMDDKFYSVQISKDKIYFSGKNGAVKIFDLQVFK